MKRIIVFGATILITGSLHAQFFAQKKTQIKLLLEQISAFKVYAGYLKDGYNIVSGGIHTINDIKNGDFNLHSDHFDALRSVNPSVQDIAQAEAIMEYAVMIDEQFEQCSANCAASGRLTKEELAYIGRVHNNVRVECENAVAVLSTLTTDSLLEMHDDERLQRINDIYLDMQDAYSFTESFTKQALVLAANRQRSGAAIEKLYKLYNIK